MTRTQLDKSIAMHNISPRLIAIKSGIAPATIYNILAGKGYKKATMDKIQKSLSKLNAKGGSSARGIRSAKKVIGARKRKIRKTRKSTH